MPHLDSDVVPYLLAANVVMLGLAREGLLRVLLRAGDRSMARVRPGREWVIGWWLRHLSLRPAIRIWGWFHTANAAADLGRSDAAVRAMEIAVRRCRQVNPSTCVWAVVNGAVNLFVNAGRYDRALTIHQLWSAEARDEGRKQQPLNYGYAQINRAEALHNLGRNAEALQLLDTVEPLCQDDDLARNGLRLLRAWILAHDGRASDAQREMSAIETPSFGAGYTAEVHYARSAIARELGDFETAEREARAGLATARRTASKRNGHALVGAALLARGDAAGAVDALQAFARDGYHGQAACGLVCLGAACEVLGRRADAEAAYQLAQERDPESWLAAAARDGVDRLRAGDRRPSA